MMMQVVRVVLVTFWNLKIPHKMWNVEEARKSSSYRELKTIVLGSESFFEFG